MSEQASDPVAPQRDRADARIVNIGERSGSSTAHSPHESDELFRILVSGVTDYAIFMLDPSGHIISWNEGAQRIKGFKAHEIIGRHLSTFYSEEEVAAGKPEWELVIAAAEGRFEDEGWRIRKDGTRFWANVTITALKREDGTLRGFAKVTRDITDRREEELRKEEQAQRQADRLRQHAERMARLEKVKSEFLNLVSHELRGPLGVLRGYISMIADGTLGQEQLREVTPVLTAKLQQMEMLVRQMVETARLESEQVELKTEKVDLEAIAESVAKSYRPLSPRHEIKVVRQEGPFCVTADQTRVETIISNLVDNAIKYSPDGGAVVISLARGDQRLYVTVRDEGIGIARDDVEKLFRRFARTVDDALGISGIGLGLYISREIARRHGGDILVQSHFGDGSSFTLTLPIKDELRSDGQDAQGVA
jgi:PAS domain S-box-containing protein